MQDRFVKLGCYLGYSLITLSFLRFLLWFIYPNDFVSLSLNETVQSFLMGVRIDLITILTFVGLLILLLFLPFAFTKKSWFQNFIGWAWYIILMVIVLVEIADIIYFQFVHRHVGNEITALSNDMHIFWDMLEVYIALFIVYLLFMLFSFIVFKKIINIKVDDYKISYIQQGLLLVAVVLFIFLGIRSKISGKSFGISDSFVVNKSASGNLALNGFFTLYRTVTKKQKDYHFYTKSEALKEVRSLIKSPAFKMPESAYPVSRVVIDKNNTTPYNIVIILLESWSAKFVDSYGGNSFKVTPYFDKLAKEGVVFSNFFANGQRSIEGITALFTGVPFLKGFNYLGSGLELSKLNYIGTLAKQNNYLTISIQSSDRRSFRMESVSKIAGFDEYYGAEDILEVGEEDSNVKPRFGTWDGNMFKFLSKRLSNVKEPFLSFAFTSTTHVPFVSPGKKWERYPHDNSNIYGFLNTLNYSDSMLHEFMQRSRKESWFDRTVFIFMADHTVGFGDDSMLFNGVKVSMKQPRELENMRIPLLIYAPKIFKPKVVDTVGSQADIIPTLVDMLHWKGNFSAMSNSLFSPPKKPFAFFSSAQVIGMVDKSGYVQHTLDKRLELTGDSELEKKLLSAYQITSQFIKDNCWAK